MRHLPAGGAVGRAEGVWADELELLAATVESLDGLARLQYSAASGRRAPWKALHVPRPGERSGRGRTADQMRELFGQVSKRGN